MDMYLFVQLLMHLRKVRFESKAKTISTTHYKYFYIFIIMLDSNTLTEKQTCSF